MLAKDGQCKIAKAEANFRTKKTNKGKLKGEFPYDAIPDKAATWRTPSTLHPDWQTERQTFYIMNEGQRKGET